MIEDELLKWKFKCGSTDSLRRIYEKYLDYLLTLAMGLLQETSTAEDVVHDVFFSFEKSKNDFRLRGSLKGYLVTCVVNRARDQIRTNRRHSATLDGLHPASSNPTEPDRSIICSEESERLNRAIARLPHEQREVVILRVKGELKFKEIAEIQGVSVNTIRGRYRYGMNRLRSILNGEVEK